MRTNIKNLISLFAVAFFITSCEGQVKEESKADQPPLSITIEQKQKESGIRSDTVLRNDAQYSGVDFRQAAHLVTPAVVHVNATWNTISRQDDSRELDPFKDFFGDEWFKFFEPYKQRGPIHGSASGVIVTPDGYIITNNHVIQDADEIEVVLHDQRSYKAKVIGSDPKTDLSLLKIDETHLTFIEFGNSDDVVVGEWVLAVGNPFNLASTVTAGIVSAKARNIGILKDREAVESFIQTDAAVNPGNSGGALVDLSGKLIGINTAIATPTGTYAGYSFAIPINIVKKVSNDLLNFGTVKRGYLGVVIRDMTGDLAKELKIKFTPGVYVDSLLQDGAALKAGIKLKDIIIKIDDYAIETSPELQEVVARHRPGEKVKVIVIRDGVEKQIIVELKGPQTTTRDVKKETEIILRKLGIEVEELSAKEKQEYNVRSGLKVTRITAGKVQELTSIKKNFIITSVNEKVVYTKDDLIRILEMSNGQILIEGTYPGTYGLYYYGFHL